METVDLGRSIAAAEEFEGSRSIVAAAAAVVEVEEESTPEFVEVFVVVPDEVVVALGSCMEGSVGIDAVAEGGMAVAAAAAAVAEGDVAAERIVEIVEEERTAVVGADIAVVALGKAAVAAGFGDMIGTGIAAGFAREQTGVVGTVGAAEMDIGLWLQVVAYCWNREQLDFGQEEVDFDIVGGSVEAIMEWLGTDMSSAVSADEPEGQESGRTGLEVTEHPEPDRPGLAQRSLEEAAEEEGERSPSDMIELELAGQESGRPTGLSVSWSCSS